MVANKVVTSFKSDLRRLTNDLDSSLAGLSLCMVFQKRHPIDPARWNLCVAADGLDTMSDLSAIAFVLEKLERDYAPETSRAIENILILRSTDPATGDLLRDIESEADASLLIGRSVFGRVIGRVQVLLLRVPAQLSAARASVLS